MFDVSSMLEVRRAMRLQNELGFNLVVAGVDQSWMIIDDLKKTNTPIFLSLDMPDEPKAAKGDDVTDEVRALEARRDEFYKMSVGQAAALEAAGITFGFSTKGARGNKVKGNVMTMIENLSLIHI